jgi:hypothetical protein
MGKHNKPNPKKISFLGSTAGAFGALMSAVAIFTATSLSGDVPNEVHPKEAIHQPTKIEQSKIAVTGESGTSSMPVLPSVVPAENPVGPVDVNVPQPPKLNPGTDVGARVDVPPAANIGVDTDVHADVPLLSQTVDVVDETVTGLLDSVDGLLGN